MGRDLGPGVTSDLGAIGGVERVEGGLQRVGRDVSDEETGQMCENQLGQFPGEQEEGADRGLCLQAT